MSTIEQKIIDKAVTLNDLSFKESKIILRLESMLRLMAEYQVGELGHDDTMYLACINSLHIIKELKTNSELKKTLERNEELEKMGIELYAKE